LTVVLSMVWQQVDKDLERVAAVSHCCKMDGT
jgi:hypothetical protein